MSALKLFISHSSRLDDVEHKYTREDRNWRLLEDTCKAIREKYGDRVAVLVDKDGLIPGEDWNRQLNLWLAECHVAIVLFSKRAVETSDWVAKEAAILSWRAELDKDFTLIPVLLDGESEPEDLAKDFLGVLKIDTNQCIREAKSAGDILAGIVQKLGGPEDLAGAHPRTPLERACELFRQVRALWVQPAAAGYLPLALRHKHPLALAGRFVTLAGSSELEYVKEEIRRRFLGPGLPPMIDGAMQDQMVNQDPKTIVLVVVAEPDTGGLPDPALLRDLQRLETDYRKLVLIFSLETAADALPDPLQAVQPPLDPLCEQQAYLAERAAKTYLNQKYGIGP